MGKSKTIQQQQELNQEFQKYVEQMNTDMEKRKQRINNKLTDMEQAHYVNFPDKALLLEGAYSHLTTTSEWSLKMVSTIIDACSRALFGSKVAPDGTEKKDTSTEVSSSIQATKDREQYIANAAFDVVQSILGGFSATTSTSVESKLDGKPIAPGMTLFIGVENNAYTNSKFLSSEKIIQTIFVFKVFYSIKEGEAQSKLSDLQLYEDQKQLYRNKIGDIDALVDSLDIKDADYEEKFTKYMDMAERMGQRMDKITEKIKQLANDKAEADHLYCKQVLRRIRARDNRAENTALTDTLLEDSIHQRRSSPFTYTGGQYSATQLVQNRLNQLGRGDVTFSLKQTDHVGNHYTITFYSPSMAITLREANDWISTALNVPGSDIRFEFG